jgi:hypothetical protein
MKKLRGFKQARLLPLFGVIVVLIGMLLYKLGSLAPAFSASERHIANLPVGWHGIYHQPLYLPIKLVQSIIFYLFPAHGYWLSRLPSVVFGLATILAFIWLVRLWHGMRVALLAGLLFATSAWTLHISRLAVYDVLYLWAAPSLLLAHLLLQKLARKPLMWYAYLALLGLMIYVPGLIWLVLLELYLQRRLLKGGWKHFGRFWQRLLYLLAAVLTLPLLIIDLGRPGELTRWLGLPAHLSAPLTLLKQYAETLYHLFGRGPNQAGSWLPHAPVLDIFSLAMCLTGIYFYATHFRSSRSRALGLIFVIGVLLIGLGGPVMLSLLVPLLYLAAATGIAYLLREWLRVFPVNPLARGVGMGLISIAVCLSCVYNLRAYFVAWPHNQAVQAVFHYRR